MVLVRHIVAFWGLEGPYVPLAEGNTFVDLVAEPVNRYVS